MNLSLAADDVTEVVPQGANGEITLQNLGPGDVYVDSNEDVSETTGLKMVADDPPITLVASKVYVVADTGGADLRYFDGS